MYVCVCVCMYMYLCKYFYLNLEGGKVVVPSLLFFQFINLKKVQKFLSLELMWEILQKCIYLFVLEVESGNIFYTPYF